jgi:hypothetical protein
VGRVATGLRPEWPSNNPSQGLVDALWEQIEACWSQEPKERPTASQVLQTLLALGETQHLEPEVPVEGSDDETVKEWEQVEDDPDSTFWAGRRDVRSDIWLVYSVSDTRGTQRTS